ncbi:MAG: type 1 glutamine amidotransferase [Rhodothermales bacterium]|jgi:type 1 glutamine amidotransferase
MKKGSRGKISILGETAAPKAKGPEKEQEWPAFWTVEHSTADGAQEGRVFCCVLGHFNAFQESVFFRLMVARAVAWSMREPAGAFTEFVTK